MPIAALPMYDADGLHDANDALWSSIAAQLRRDGIEAPLALTRDADLDEVWTAPDLLLAQTCGYPLVTSLTNGVRLVATPRYTAPGCEGAWYRSAILVRTADESVAGLAGLRGGRCAVNGFGSNSGMNVLRAAIAPLAVGGQFFGEVTETGSHAASLRAVAGGLADCAAIDCVTWALHQRLHPSEAAPLRVLCWTASTPGLPLITAGTTGAATRDAMRRALDDAAASPALASARAALLLDGFETVPLAAYDAIKDLEQNARRLGYPELR